MSRVGGHVQVPSQVHLVGGALGRAGAVTALSSGTETLGAALAFGDGAGTLHKVFRMLMSHIRELLWQRPEFCGETPHLQKVCSPPGAEELSWRRSVNRKSQTRNPVAKISGRACGSALEVCLRH